MPRKKREPVPENDLTTIELGPRDCALILRVEPDTIDVVTPGGSMMFSEAAFWTYCFATLMMNGTAGKPKAMLDELRAWYLALVTEAKLDRP